ncbi:MAG: gliding motility-associated C-terminal domain-containing protein [Bacteroidetes bacterium]|nr:gliding motility-associated C-terminal domain-containing protein [Bacteroidota bacterium]
MDKSITLFWALLPFLFLPFSGEMPKPVAEAATPSAPPCNCTVTQGSFSSPLPFMSGSTSAVNFYSYGNPAGASANTGLELSETFLLMLYEDMTSGNTSLIMILDQANDGTGGSAAIAVDCLPGTAFVDLSDDGGELSGSPPLITGNFNWAACCTDGGVISGVGCGNTFTINPNISSGITAFSLVYGSVANPIYVNMPEINCPITINCGGTSCCAGAFEFTGTAQNASCMNSGDGAINISTDCAATPTFAWSNGATTEDISGLAPGSYSITITDANGCSQSASYSIVSANPDPQPTITGPTEFCAGESVELGVSGSYSSYLWSNGQTLSSIFVSAPGTYTVTVTNAAGCSGTANTTLTQNPLPVPNITGPTTICFYYDTITLNAGPGFTNYQWSTGDFTQTIDVTQFGSYFVTVTNSFGCTGSDFTIVTPLANPFPFIIGPTSVCPGAPIALDAGQGYNSYLWSNGATTEAIVTFMEGTYSVTVTNADNCVGTTSHEVTENPADTVAVFQTSCNPQDTGVFVSLLVNQYGCDSLVTLTVSFSESDFVFLTSQSCNPQDTGIFIQTYTNQYGCDSVVTETVTLLPSDGLFFLDYSCSPQDTGIVVQSLTNQFGCDSVVTTTTFLLASDTVQVFAQSCDPADAGVTQALFVNSLGCDSLVITTTDYILVDTTYLVGTTCDINQAGQSEQLFASQDGCDSLVITTVNLLFSDTTYLTANTCDFNQAGQSEQLFANQDGCDSLVITTTTFIQPDTTLLFSATCDLAQMGVSEVVLANSFGCDSVVITTVSLLPSDTTFLSQTSCDPTQAGTQELLLTNEFGCDSLLVITTNYALADSTFINETTCDPAASGVAVQVLMSTDGCDSVVTTTTILLPSDTVQVMAQSCDPANVGTVGTLLFNQYGCDSLVITTTELLPSDTTYLQASTCDIGQVGQSEVIFSNQYGCDSLIITTTIYNPSDTTLLFSESCDPNAVGTVEMLLQNMFGCDSLVTTTTTLLPSNTTVLQAFSCDPSQVGTTQVVMTNSFGCDSLVITNTAQLPVDTTWLFFSSCSLMDTGLVVVQLSNQYGCDSLVFEQTGLLPASACQLDALILGDTIGCPETVGSLWLTFFNGLPPYTYTWTNQSGNTGSGTINQSGQPQQVGGLPPGAYSFEILDATGLMGALSAVIFQPDPLQIDLQVNSDFNGYGISCYGATDGSAAVAVLSGGLPPYTYNWSNGSQTGQANGLGEGWSSVAVNDAVGCLAIDSIFLAGPDSLQFSLSLAHPDCFTSGLGAIAISQVTGGSGPYRYALNGNGWQSGPLFEGLASGQYLVAVEDANGCVASSYAFVNSFTQPTVSLGPDDELQFGDSILLQAITNLPFSLLDSIYWGEILCPDCPKVIVAPIATSNYSVTVVDGLGCSASDELTVVVKKDFHVYIPNAFSPDFDGINDNFMIYSGPQVVKIREFQVFDRWGEPVFTYFNFPPNNPAYGWDGTYRDKLMDTAVFAYFAIIEFVDGSTQLVKGDVLLMR